MHLNPQLTANTHVSEEVAELAFRRLELARLERGWPDPDAPQSLAIRAARLRLDIAINRAVLATYGVTDEFDLVAELLDPKEIGRFLWEAARARRPDYVHDKAS